MDQPDLYVRRMLVNANHAWWKRRSSRDISVAVVADRPGVVDAAAEVDERDALWGVVRALPPRQRTVIVLRYYEDLDDATIAAILECSTGTVLVRTRSAPLTPCASGGARRLLRLEPAVSFDLEKRLAMTLTAHEGSAVDPAPIVAGALTRGRRLRRKQRMVRVVGVAAACLMLAGAAIWLPISGGSDRAPLPVSALLLPAAPGEPGAASRPDLVGTTPGAVHFTVDRLLAEADHVTWTAGRGIESVELRGRIAARVMLARDRAALDEVQQTLASSGSPQQPVEVRVNGRPGDAWYDPAPPPGGQGLWVCTVATGRRPLGAARHPWGESGSRDRDGEPGAVRRSAPVRGAVSSGIAARRHAPARLLGQSRPRRAGRLRRGLCSWSATRLVVGSRYGRSVCPSGSATQQASFAPARTAYAGRQ